MALRVAAWGMLLARERETGECFMRCSGTFRELVMDPGGHPEAFSAVHGVIEKASSSFGHQTRGSFNHSHQALNPTSRAFAFAFVFVFALTFILASTFATSSIPTNQLGRQTSIRVEAQFHGNGIFPLSLKT